jgi:hypothetical protein
MKQAKEWMIDIMLEAFLPNGDTTEVQRMIDAGENDFPLLASAFTRWANQIQKDAWEAGGLAQFKQLWRGEHGGRNPDAEEIALFFISALFPGDPR